MFKFATQSLHPLPWLALLLLCLGSFGGIRLFLEMSAERARVDADGLVYAKTQTDLIAQRVDAQLLA